MKTTFYLKFVLAVSFLIMACSNTDEVENATPLLNVNAETVNFEEDSSTKEIEINANKEWRATVDKNAQSWCNVEKSENLLRINVTENFGKEIRQATITIVMGSLSKLIKIQQLGWGKDILVSPEVIEMSAAGGKFTFDVTANCEYDIVTTGCDWISLPATRAHEMVKSSYTYMTSLNTEDNDRSFNLMVKEKNTDSPLQRAIYVSQKGLNEYSSGKLDVKNDLKIKVARGEASSYQSGGGIEKSFDDDMATIYHSN